MAATALGLLCATGAGGQLIQPRFRSWGMADGLAQGSIYAILQDRAGFMWFGTQDGLHRFDGYEFVVFQNDPGDATSLSDDFVRALYQDRTGAVWVGTNDGALNRLDPVTGTAALIELPGPQDDTERPSDQIPVLAIDDAPGGGLVVGTHFGAVFVDPDGGEPYVIDRSRLVSVHAMLVENDTSLWVGYDDGVLARYAVRGPPSVAASWIELGRIRLDDRIVAVRKDASGSQWVATRKSGLHRLHVAADGTVSASDPSIDPGTGLTVQDAFVDRSGLMWLATLDGLTKHDPSTGRSTRSIHDPADPRSLPHSRGLRLYEDRMGVLWIGTWAGLASLPPTRSAIRWCCGGGEAGNPTVSSVVALETDGRGRIWAGTFGSGLFAIDTLRGSVERVAWAPIGSASMGHDNVFDLAWDASGHLWVATLGGGVTRVDPTTAAARTWAVSEVGNALSVEFDRSGVLWVGTQYEGLHTFDPGRDDFVAVGTIEPSLDLGASYVWAIEEGPEGDLWIGTFGAGVRRIGPDRRWVSSYTVASHGLGGDRVLAVHADPSGAVWIGTQGGGLSRLIPETGEVDVFTTADGLPHDHVVGLVTDESGFLWITTNGGLARFDPDSERFRVFTTAAGLQGDRFFANAAHRAASGELLFGGPGGINVIDPEGSEWSEAPPATVLTRFLVNNEDRRLPSPEAGVQLDWDENFFAFEYAALDFTDPGLNRYRYMLRGVDRDWIDAGEVRSANYTAIPPGRYTFELSASNAPGVWSESVVRLPVRILPPFWGTVWFRGAIAALVFATISGIYALRVDQRRRLHALRQRIAGELHDDIGANLSTIALKAEVLRERAHLDEDARKRLSDVVRLSRNTVDALREMIWVVNTDSDTVGSLISRLEATAQTLVEGAMHLRFRSPPRVQDFQIDMQLRQDVYLLFKEAVHNAVKHSGGDIVDIEIALQKRLLSIVVEDDGIGFDPEDPVAGNGLPLMERRAKAHNGRFEVGRSAGGGTRVAASFTVS